MNPLKKPICYNESCDPRAYCLFRHLSGKLKFSPKEERGNQMNGEYRCPVEWEISAVRS